MVTTPTHQQLQLAFSSAGSAHHDYESNYLDGVHDEQWAGVVFSLRPRPTWGVHDANTAYAVPGRSFERG